MNENIDKCECCHRWFYCSTIKVLNGKRLCTDCYDFVKSQIAELEQKDQLCEDCENKKCSFIEFYNKNIDFVNSKKDLEKAAKSYLDPI